MVERKNIVLNGVENLGKRAVLTLECDGETTKGRLRLYNFGSEPKGIISLGVYQEGKVAKAGLIRASSMLYTFSCNIDKLTNNFSCAVINFVDGEPKPILYGNCEGFCDQDELLSEVITALSVSKNMTEVEDTLDKYGIDYDEKLKEEIDRVIDKSFEVEEDKTCENENCQDCEACQYKKYYLSRINEDVKEEIEEPTKALFYMEMKPQIDDLFANNPSEEYLQELLPNSKWVKVKIDEEGNYYVLGLIYEDAKLKFICYGVPGVYQKNAPRELSGYPIWFPLDESKPQGFGYWLSYQDADSGESIKATVI